MLQVNQDRFFMDGKGFVILFLDVYQEGFFSRGVVRPKRSDNSWG